MFNSILSIIFYTQMQMVFLFWVHNQLEKTVGFKKLPKLCGFPCNGKTTSGWVLYNFSRF
ncbi:MAG: hypothetical protein COB02_09945 [Candidatus Cloacimonadota bacterium]|nr:MAG: hypothetical protein COB02_09945 [Candidatus Cloacimonadota bacterium]